MSTLPSTAHTKDAKDGIYNRYSFRKKGNRFMTDIHTARKGIDS